MYDALVVKRSRVRQYVALARRIERKYHVQTCVVSERLSAKHVTPCAFSDDRISLFIVEPEEKEMTVAKAVVDEFRRSHGFNSFSIHATIPPEEMLQIIRKNPERLNQHLAAMGMLTPFLFHTIEHGTFGRVVKRRMHEELGETLEKAIEARKEKMRALRGSMPQPSVVRERKWREARKKLFGPIETRSLISQIQRVAWAVRRQKATIIIGLDGSGRPVAKMVRSVLQRSYGLNIPVFFMNPDAIRREGADFASLRTIFERQYPGLVHKLKGANVILLDDQSASNETIARTRRFLQHYSPNHVGEAFLSRYPAEPPPSWWRTTLHGVRGEEGSILSKKATSPAETRDIEAKFRSKSDLVVKRVVARINRARQSARRAARRRVH